MMRVVWRSGATCSLSLENCLLVVESVTKLEAKNQFPPINAEKSLPAVLAASAFLRACVLSVFLLLAPLGRRRVQRQGRSGRTGCTCSRSDRTELSALR
eukprot:756107-Hanusia_phi.AAC.4